MLPVTLHRQEADRLIDLATYKVVGHRYNVFDHIAEAARAVMDLDMGLVSFVDRDQQWFAGRSGVDLECTDRSTSFCTHAILSDDLMVVEDAWADERFDDNPLVYQAPFIRAYAGAVIRGETGLPLGTVCAIGLEPMHPTKLQLDALRSLRDVAAQALLEMRLRNLADALETQAAPEPRL